MSHHHTTHDTKKSTSSTLSVEQTKASTIDPLDTPNGLIAKAAKAKRDGLSEIETTEEVAKFYNNGIPAEGYFMFHGVKAYIYGHKSSAVKRDAASIEQNLFSVK